MQRSPTDAQRVPTSWLVDDEDDDSLAAFTHLRLGSSSSSSSSSLGPRSGARGAAAPHSAAPPAPASASSPSYAASAPRSAYRLDDSSSRSPAASAAADASSCARRKIQSLAEASAVRRRLRWRSRCSLLPPELAADEDGSGGAGGAAAAAAANDGLMSSLAMPYSPPPVHGVLLHADSPPLEGGGEDDDDADDDVVGRPYGGAAPAPVSPLLPLPHYRRRPRSSLAPPESPHEADAGGDDTSSAASAPQLGAAGSRRDAPPAGWHAGAMDAAATGRGAARPAGTTPAVAGARKPQRGSGVARYRQLTLAVVGGSVAAVSSAANWQEGAEDIDDVEEWPAEDAVPWGAAAPPRTTQWMGRGALKRTVPPPTLLLRHGFASRAPLVARR